MAQMQSTSKIENEITNNDNPNTNFAMHFQVAQTQELRDIPEVMQINPESMFAT